MMAGFAKEQLTEERDSSGGGRYDVIVLSLVMVRALRSLHHTRI